MMLTYAQQCPRVPLRPRIERFPCWDRRGDGDRGQTKGQTRAVGRRGEAQAEVENEEEFKGRKRQ